MSRLADDDEARERFITIGEIATEVAHELRNALQVITASAYVARQDPSASAVHIQKIERHARLAHSIVDDLMSLARGEPAHAEPILLYDVLVAARTEIGAGRAVWNDAISPADVRVRAHAGLAIRLFHALYENAIHASLPHPPTITTRAWIDAQSLVIEVGDDGPGVPAGIASQIFDPLVSGREGGTGLGLSLARRIAAAHAGGLALVATSAGAMFRLTLPHR
ncbi:MAG TPA: HAMP domain-containing sensor histidine kinase [Polyangiaceae bacterium]|nr:HAMP domain-containing sensor histidine kinase [Polyangiaceae bacterium]